MARVSAVVLAAGKGTRMKSERAKVLHPICGAPLAAYPLRAALGAGAEPVVVVVGHQAAEALQEAGLSKALCRKVLHRGPLEFLGVEP